MRRKSREDLVNQVERAIEILRRTADGRELSPMHLGIVQAAVNDRLTPNGKLEFAALYEEVCNGTYRKLNQSLFGIRHLTRDHEGYVYWRGKRVEHFSHSDVQSMQEAAIRLAEQCRALEAKGFPVTGRTAIWPELLEVSFDTPWLEALLRYYAFFVKGDEVCGVFYRYDRGLQTVALVKRDGIVQGHLYEDGYHAFHGTQAQGFQPVGGQSSPSQLIELLERSGLTPQEIHSALI